MTGLDRLPLPRFLRVLAWIVLVVGVVARPLSVVACDIDDARRLLAAEYSAATSIGPEQDAGDCCAGASCGECCMPASTVLPAMPRVAAFVPMVPQASPEPADPLAPSVYPVAPRPPIRG